ncbi:Ion channel family protein [Acanthocheilonema viteae]
MCEELTEFLEDKENIDESSCKKYMKLVLPHVILVAAVCFYAIAGAWVFYSLESPHEDKLKKIGIQKIDELRKELIQTLRMKRKELKRTKMDSWARVTDVKLQTFNEYLYRAFKEHYVRYADIRIFKTNIDKRSGNTKIRRKKSKHGSKSIRSKKLWTASSAIFFAATTMATIGYGNIVPITSHGRIACVIFALFGVPLAIITIGDLGKFLSECTIWLYTKMKKSRFSLKRYSISLKLRTARNPELRSPEKSNEAVKQLLNWNDALDKTKVPLVLVLTILLFYIAFGGFLFASFEPWTYTDAFYFCFVSLTTIGFGDLVPESQEYVPLMLVYLGIGLAVTTMCIDLVGIQYIQKIHYFGRKFRHTDILQLLKRRQMIEQGLTIDQNDEFLKLYLKQLQEAGTVSIEEPKWHLWSNASEMSIPASYDINDDNNNGSLGCIEVHKVSCTGHPSVIFHASENVRSSSKSLVFSEEIESKQSLKKSNPNQIAEEPQKFSIHSPIQSLLPTAESLERITNESCRRRSFSIERFSVNSSSEQIPNPKLITSNSPIFTKEQPSLASQSLILSQQQLPGTKPSSISVALVSPSSSLIGLACMTRWNSYTEMLNEAKNSFAKPEIKATEMFLDDSTMATYENEDYQVEHEEIFSNKYEAVSKSSQSSSSTISSTGQSMQIIRPSKLDLDTCESVERISTTSKAPPEQDIQQSVIYYQNIPIHSRHQKTVETENALQNLLDAPECIVSHKLPPAVVDDNYCFVIDGETIGSEAMLHDDIHWSHTSRPTQYFYSDDLRNFHRVNCIKAKGKIIAIKIIGSQAQTFSAVQSSRSTPIHPFRSVDSLPARSISSISGFRRDTISLLQVYVVTRIYSFWKTCPSFRRIVTLFDRVNGNENIHFQKRIFVQHIWRNTKQSEKERVKHEFNRDRARLLKSKSNEISTKHAFK